MTKIREKSDLHFALKETASSLMNHHRPSDKPNIGMFSSRRSGTTLISQLFGRAPGIKSIDQPLSSYTASARHGSYLPPFAGSYPFQLHADDEQRLRALFQGWHEGRLHFAEPWRLGTADFKWRSDRLFFKFTESHAIFDSIRSFIPLTGFAFFRHPVPHALSCLRLGWSARGGNFLQQRHLLEAFFDPTQVAFIVDIDKNGSEFERILANWFVENRPLLLRSQAEPGILPLFTYEDVVTEPAETLAKIAEHCGVILSQRMLDSLTKPSRSSRGKKMKSDVGELLKEGNKEKIVTGWLAAISEDHLEKSKRIFDKLNCHLYEVDQPMPLGTGE